MLSLLYFFFIAGITLYVAGFCWLFYINVSFKSRQTVDTETQANRVAWAVFLSVLGIVLTMVMGIMTYM